MLRGRVEGVHVRALLLALALSGCVRSVTTCIEASHSRPSPDWQRNDSVGASVCVEHSPRE
jgi:hypothetical protein